MLQHPYRHSNLLCYYITIDTANYYINKDILLYHLSQ
jgi:hypothetical protein